VLQSVVQFAQFALVLRHLFGRRIHRLSQLLRVLAGLALIRLHVFLDFVERVAEPRAAFEFEHGEHYKHLGVYAYTKRFVDVFARLPVGRLEQLEMLEQLRALEYGYRIKVVETPFDSPEVDEPEDLRRIEALLAD